MVSASGTVHDLQDMLLGHIPQIQAAFLRGAEVSHSLHEIFEDEEKITILEKVVYEMTVSKSISDKLLNTLKNSEISHVYSSQGVRLRF